MKPGIGTLALIMPLVVALAACTRESPRPDDDPSLMQPPGVVVRGRIDIEGGELPLVVSVDGVIASVDVHEGDRVAKGQVLVTIDPTAARIDEELAQARLAGTQSQVKLDQARVVTARTRSARLAEAARMDAGDGQSADDAREVLAQVTGDLDGAKASLSAARAELKRARYALSQHVLRAPVDGQMLQVMAGPGLHVGAQGKPVAILLPAKARIIRAELSEDIIDDVVTGKHARVLSDDGRQTPLGPAHVLRIGTVYGPSTLQEDPQQRINERTVECVLAYDGSVPLRVGRRVLVRFASRTPEADAATYKEH